MAETSLRGCWGEKMSFRPLGLYTVTNWHCNQKPLEFFDLLINELARPLSSPCLQATVPYLEAGIFARRYRFEHVGHQTRAGSKARFV